MTAQLILTLLLLHSNYMYCVTVCALINQWYMCKEGYSSQTLARNIDVDPPLAAGAIDSLAIH